MLPQIFDLVLQKLPADLESFSKAVQTEEFRGPSVYEFTAGAYLVRSQVLTAFSALSVHPGSAVDV